MKTSKKLKIYSIVMTFVSTLLLCAFLFIFFRENYDNKILSRLGLQEREAATNLTLKSWKSSLEQLRYDADIVFFGDSITRGGDFQGYIPDLKVVNVGLSGDSLSGMLERVDMVAAVKPEKVFILGGINQLSNQNAEQCSQIYGEIIDEIYNRLPECEIYIQSVLPTAAGSKAQADNEHIHLFNKALEELATQKNCIYIDLNSIYSENGVLSDQYSKDGTHIRKDAYDVWIEEITPYIY